MRFERNKLIGFLRTVAMVLAVVLPGGCRHQAEREQTLIETLAARAAAANDAFVRGDMRRWYDLAGPMAEDFTLMQPFGGVSRGFDASDERLDQLARYFTGGEATFELVQGLASRDVAVLVFIERQRAVVGGLDEQNWSLRVTQVYRRRGDIWELAHRHADVLTENIGLERTAELARTG